MRIDLGSGENKHIGCIGIDKIPYVTTDIVHDYNMSVPLDNDSVNMVMCSHSLQYVNDLNLVMQDLYRICRHKAIVCIVAPYAHASIHMVNPQFKQQFNEHSPKYWTTSPAERALDESELSNDPAIMMHKHRLIEPIGVDFRLLQMEFFYYPAYHGLYNEVELELLRQSQLNVAHQIMYHLLVVKKPITDTEFADIAKASVLEEPGYVAAQRMSTNHVKEDAEQPFNLDHFRSFSHEDEDMPANEKEEKLPVPQQGSRGSRQTSSKGKKRNSSKRKGIRRKKKSGLKK
ncbi:hypothetical protein OM416_29200 [Paenibacillus sp. LS1]|uniref:hypothetical protein n=1 Tax=Paenibacillus sp. LS1 TaxID=2992120 RepID=UPI00223027AA|nr:hypothetical protein [Paenibacillus sp. LS1]MCW3795671.1 hypothetical protein [Paenibacillus sp. LS1]